MKMVKAVIRPEKVYEVMKKLEERGFKGLTILDVLGRGKEGGIQVGETSYDELAKTLLMMVVNDEDTKTIVDTIMETANNGIFGDGKVFISPVDEVWTIRTKSKGL